jgi:amidohydrolase
MTIEPHAPADSDLVGLYQDLHAHPELSFQETRTAALVADQLRRLGYQTATGVGRTGVVGILRNGEGPIALLRADMDGLPVLEGTGLVYASGERGVGRDGREVPVMHACGHDMHVSCLIGACRALAENRQAWSGTLMVVFQPAEEIGAGAQAMIDDSLFDRFGRPGVVLGQHVFPFPAADLPAALPDRGRGLRVHRGRERPAYRGRAVGQARQPGRPGPAARSLGPGCRPVPGAG